MKLWLMSLLLFLASGLAFAQEETPVVFSGKTQVYEDRINGFRLEVPVEFQLTNHGANTSWEGPKVEDFATSLFVEY